MTAADKDYIGMWYRARRRCGIDDAIHFAVIDPEGAGERRYSIPHRHHDGIGGLLVLLRQWGVPLPPVPHSRQSSPPPWWQWLRAPGAPPGQPLPWRRLRGPEPHGQVETTCFDPEATAAIMARAKQEHGSLNSLLLHRLHRAVGETLLETPSTGSWLYPVNMRGAVSRPRDDMNLSSGFYVPVAPEQSVAVLYAALREGLRQQQHWRFWHLAHVGRWVGERGVDWLCRRMLEGPGHLGSFSNLGVWRLDLGAAGFSDSACLAVCGPGSPNHPVANGAIIVNGRLTLSLRVNASLTAGRLATRKCLNLWRHFLLEEDA